MWRREMAWASWKQLDSILKVRVSYQDLRLRIKRRRRIECRWKHHGASCNMDPRLGVRTVGMNCVDGGVYVCEERLCLS
jgi:hypothetical protein